MTTGTVPGTADPLQPVSLPSDEAARLAEQHHLHPVGQRPVLKQYLTSLWQRRYFLWELTLAKVAATTSDERLGSFWQIANPVLNVGVYYLAFGILLGTRSDSDNFLLFLVAGVFVFTAMNRGIMSGATSIVHNKGLLQALRFPRAVLPVSAVLREVVQFGPSLVVLLITAVATGEPIRLRMLLIIPVLLMAALFTAGTALIFARLVSSLRDVGQLLPFMTRVWLYLSGVFFSLDKKLEDAHGAVLFLAQANPGWAYLELTRGALMPGHPVGAEAWITAVVWATVLPLLGMLFFWRGEETYGRG
ncbi:MAG: teichoic acid transport system permease protein [Actinomycetota bacterium]|nr:teichoic acid transport system permease protein [Actinomycetota bacterium]